MIRIAGCLIMAIGLLATVAGVFRLLEPADAVATDEFARGLEDAAATAAGLTYIAWGVPVFALGCIVEAIHQATERLIRTARSSSTPLRWNERTKQYEIETESCAEALGRMARR